MKKAIFIALFVLTGRAAFSQVVPYVVSNYLLCLAGPQLEMTIPNVFTPNGDYKNENFIPIVQGEICLDNYYMAVYNRYGQLLHESRVYSEGWNGNDFDGNPYPEGTYYYTATYKAIPTNEKTPQTVYKKGFLQLIR